MAKLYFKFGAMGCSKTAQALITKFNYEERNMKVLLLKPAIDNRDGADIVKSRIGLQQDAVAVREDENLYETYAKDYSDCNVIIVDECQFLTPEQVDQLADIVIQKDIPVLCFGLATDFRTHLFPGSKRLFEIAESISEIKSVCTCGAKATVNARIDDNGKIVMEGSQVCLGGNDRYIGHVPQMLAQEKSAIVHEFLFVIWGNRLRVIPSVARESPNTKSKKRNSVRG